MKGSAAAKVGATVLFTLLLSFIGFRFVAKGIQSGGGYHVFGLFRDATGLVDKSRVQIAGLDVGEITDRRLEGAAAKVTMRVKGDVVLWSNATLYKKTASLLGEFYLEIDPGTEESPDPLTGQIKKNSVLKNGDQIKNVVEAVTTSDILVQVNETLPVLRSILTDVRQITKGPLQDIAQSVKSGVDKNSLAAERLLGHLDQIALDVRGITGGKANGDIRTSIANIKDITEGVKQLVGTGNNEVGSTGQKIRSNLDKISLAIDSLNSTLANTQHITDKVNKGEGTVGRLLNDDTIANNVEQITTDAGSFIRSLTRLQTLVGLRSEYNVLANTLKTYVSIELQARPDRFFLIELVDDPRGLRSTQRTFTTTDDPTKPQTVNTETVTISDQFRFSFQLAKRFFLLNGHVVLTGRFGIKESTGGIGGDVDLPLRPLASWARTLSLKVDLFDFRSNIYPRLKVLAAFEFFRHLWLVGGVDDIFNSNGPGGGGFTGRDYFFGVQLTFTDDDLKSLLAVGGAALLGSIGK